MFSVETIMTIREAQAENRKALVREAREVMRKRIDEPNLKLKDVADDVFTSTRHLQRAFQERKTTFTRELTQLRIRVAQALLEDNPDVAIQDVAKASGFTHAGHFSGVFKRSTGVHPKEWRATLRQMKLERKALS